MSKEKTENFLKRLLVRGGGQLGQTDNAPPSTSVDLQTRALVGMINCLYEKLGKLSGWQGFAGDFLVEGPKGAIEFYLERIKGYEEKLSRGEALTLEEQGMLVEARSMIFYMHDEVVKNEKLVGDLAWQIRLLQKLIESLEKSLGRRARIIKTD